MWNRYHFLPLNTQRDVHLHPRAIADTRPPLGIQVINDTRYVVAERSHSPELLRSSDGWTRPAQDNCSVRCYLQAEQAGWRSLPIGNLRFSFPRWRFQSQATSLREAEGHTVMTRPTVTVNTVVTWVKDVEATAGSCEKTRRLSTSKVRRVFAIASGVKPPTLTH